MTQTDAIKINAEMAIQKLGPLSGMAFGYNRDSVAWVEGYLERLRRAGQFQDEATKQGLINVLGSFLGECIIRCYGGGWRQHEGEWCVAFQAPQGGEDMAFPFAKVSKQIEKGLDDGILGFFEVIPAVLAEDSPARRLGKDE
jgi:hypothetical protein